MKYKAILYAKALAGMDEKKFHAKHFLRVLEKNGDVKKLRQIVMLAEKILLAKSGNQKIVLETARPLRKKVKVGKKGDVIEEKINPDLIAGMKIMINGEKQLDFSLQRKLSEIFK